MRFITEYSLWYFPFCVIFSGALAYYLYLNNKRYDHFSKNLKIVLFVLRWTIFSGLFFYLLKPFIQYVQRKEEKPKLILLHDNSSSISYAFKNAENQLNYLKEWSHFFEDLSKVYDVEPLLFSSEVQKYDSLSFSEKQSNISGALQHIQKVYPSDKIGSVVLVSDGLFNAGQNPLYEAWNFSCPLYSVGIGDTNQYRDIKITRVRNNKISFLGNTFPVEVNFSALECSGLKTTISIEHQKKVIHKQEVSIKGNTFFGKEQFLIKASTAGLQKYTVRLTQVSGERTIENNSYDVFVEVLNNQQKILLLASQPHPDIAAMRSVLENMEGVRVEFSLLESWKGNAIEYQLVIVHQAFVDGSVEKKLSSVISSSVPSIWVYGKNTSAALWNKNFPHVQVKGKSLSFHEVNASFNKDFQAYTLSETSKQKITKFPPLWSPMGDIAINSLSDVLAHQKIASITSEVPLFFTYQDHPKKQGFMMGEGFWRWKLSDYQQNESCEAWNEFFSKFVQYHFLKEKKSRLKVLSENKINENQKIQWEAQVYDENFVLSNQEDLLINIEDQQGKNYRFQFQKQGEGYLLDAGYLPVGEYKWKTEVKLNHKLLQESGHFTVLPLQMEALETRADFHLMHKLAKDRTGDFYTEGQLDLLKQKLLKSGKLKPKIKNHKNLVDLINLRWIFILFMLLLTSEWAIKKYYTSY